MHYHKLTNIQGLTFNDLERNIRLGGKFVTYQYTISLLAVTLTRLTRAYYIPPGTPATAYKRTANLVSLFFGWWCIPWGPIRTIQGIAANNKGGVDITADIMANITREDFANSCVNIAVVYTPFDRPSKTETEELRKALAIFSTQHPDTGDIYFAVDVNNTEPVFVIGLHGKFAQPPYTDELKKILKKYFMRNTSFEFMDIAEDNEMVTRLKEIDLKQS